MLALLALAACSSNQADEVEQQSKTAASASATVSMAIDAWLAGAVPRHYTLRTLQSMRKELADADAQIRAATATGQAGMGTSIEHSADAVSRAQTALKNDSRAEVERAGRDIRAAASGFPGGSRPDAAPK